MEEEPANKPRLTILRGEAVSDPKPVLRVATSDGERVTDMLPEAISDPATDSSEDFLKEMLGHKDSSIEIRTARGYRQCQRIKDQDNERDVRGV